MSKAFLRETDLPELSDRPPPSLLPFGAKNYVTPGGLQRMREELARHLEIDRPPLIAGGMDGEAKRQLQALDQRIHYLEQSLRTAVVVERPHAPIDEIRFGATVTVRDQKGETSTYRIVGVDEVESERGHISWLSPIARALVAAKAGQRVIFKSPVGEQPLDVLAIVYE